jgi:hypothetical protein
MRVIQVCEHEIVIIALLAVNVATLCPAFGLVPKDLVDGSLAIFGIVISAGEVIPVILLLGILAAPPAKVEAQPGINLVGVRDGLCAVVRIDFLRKAFFLMISSCLMIEN